MTGKPKWPVDDAAKLRPTSMQYVWDAEDGFPVVGEVAITIGDLRLTLDLRFPHERRYALGFLFGLRNPQADIDRQLFQRYVQPGDVVLDAGANIGVTAAEALACGASHVICVEPEADLVRRLNALQLTAPDRITIWQFALGAHQGVANLLLSRTHNQGHTLSTTMTSLFPDIFDGRHQRVPTSTIDTILSHRPSDLWKLDVEGLEAEVINGARRTLEQSPPRAILAELYDPFVDKVINLLSGYRVQRAALAKADYAVQLLDQIGGALPEDFCPISPTYVFTRLD